MCDTQYTDSVKTLPIPEPGKPDSAVDLHDKQVCGSTKRPTGREEEKGAEGWRGEGGGGRGERGGENKVGRKSFHLATDGHTFH